MAAVVDDEKREVPVPATVRRVVSLVPSLTEAVAETAPGLLVGATDWCTHPGDLDVTRIRGTKNPDVETVLALRPDLVLANQEENRLPDLDALRAGGAPVYVTDIRDVDGSFDSLARMLAACRLDEPAWLRSARTLWAGVVAAQPRRRAVVPIWRKPWMAVGSDTFTGAILDRLGVDNVLARDPQRYPRFDPRELPAHDLVVLPDEPYLFTADDGPEAFDAPSALVSGRLLTWYGPSLVEAARVLPDALRTVVMRDPAPVDERLLSTLVLRLDLERKVRLLTGADFWSTAAEPAIGLRRMVFSDGPAGVRGESFDEREPSLCMPSPTALGATWDPALARRYGAALGAEARRQGVHVVLGPTINLHRTPFAGRHFEAFSEDPLLTAELAAGYVEGLQAHGVAATPKHYVANDAETERVSVDNLVGARALRELYLAAFEPALTRAHAWAVMSAYNSVDGVTMSENPLLSTPLHTEWGFDGLVMSDWGAVRSTEASANAAQHLVMPGPTGAWGAALVDAVRAGMVAPDAVDEKVRRLLRLAARVGALDGVAPAVPDPPPDEDGRAPARSLAAAGMVLVRNAPTAPGWARGTAGTAPGLPWDRLGLGSVAVLGHNASTARVQGGGSATVRPAAVVSPLEGLRTALGPDVVRYRMGALVADGVQPFDPGSITNPVTGGPGLRAVFRDADGAELLAEDRLAASLIWMGPEIPAGTDVVELRTRWGAPAGTHRVGASGAGALSLQVDGAAVLDTVAELPDGAGPGAEIFEPPSRSAGIRTDGGPVELMLRFRPRPATSLPVVAVTLGEELEVEDPDAEVAAAAALAADCEVALVVVGTGDRIESEGFDRTSLALPGHQDALVRAVAAANPHTVVLVNSGAPVLLPWRDEVAAVLLGWFGGERFGDAVADVLLGTVEPGGRLPTTWPDTGAERAVLSGVPERGTLRYTEGVHVGHRNWLRTGETPAYPFGHGLGYTTWTLDDAAVGPPTSDGGMGVEVTVSNTGDRAGRQVVQAYLSRDDGDLDRPARWLAGWTIVDADPGQSTVSLPIAARAFRHWSESTGGWATEPGTFTLHVGFSVTDTPFAVPLRRGRPPERDSLIVRPFDVEDRWPPNHLSACVTRTGWRSSPSTHRL